jgi:hypothetical protein
MTGDGYVTAREAQLTAKRRTRLHLARKKAEPLQFKRANPGVWRVWLVLWLTALPWLALAVWIWRKW